MIKTVAFDFDGVIVDSAKIKRQAYFDLFPDKKVKNIVYKVLSEIEGSTRFDIFRRIFTDLNYKEEELEQKIQEYSDKYNNLAQKFIKKSGKSQEIVKVLTILGKNYDVYINSNTPQEPLEESTTNLGIAMFFKGIFGVPKIKGTYVNNNSKRNNLSKIIKIEQIAPNNLVFVGDGEGDLNAAKDVGCLFIGVQNGSNNWTKQNFPLIKNVKELPDIIRVL